MIEGAGTAKASLYILSGTGRSLCRAQTRSAHGVRPERLSEQSAAEQRAWVDRYMKAFEPADVEGLERLLTEDVVMEMPPMLNWFVGPGQLRPVHGVGLRAGRNGLVSEGGRGQRPARVCRLYPLNPGSRPHMDRSQILKSARPRWRNRPRARLSHYMHDRQRRGSPVLAKESTTLPPRKRWRTSASRWSSPWP
jgi:hypothetical protein